MKIVVGLGNPGFRYKNTRHNVGFLTVNSFAKKHKIRINQKAFGGIFGRGKVLNGDVAVLLPQTYMNLSGVSVASIKGKLDTLKDLLIVYDDIDLVLGNIRFRLGGSSAGHKGINSIIEKLKTDNFPRLRIGIKSEKRVEDAKDFVLRSFTRSEKATLNNVITEAVTGIEDWVSGDIESCMTKYNRKQDI